MRTRVSGLILAAAAVAASPQRASAQFIQPVPPANHSAVPPGLVDCTAEAANVSGFVDGAGQVSIYNVPSNQGAVRVRATCNDGQGNTVLGQSAPIVPVPGGVTHFSTLDFGSYVPIAARLTMTPQTQRLVGLGSSLQLSVGATFADLTTGNVTAGSTGTTYRSTNPAVATVSADGLVTAVGAGTTLIYALNEGASGLASINVLPAALQSLAVVPGSVELVINPIFHAQPAQLQVTGTLTDNSTVSLTSGSSGTTYSSSNPAVAAVSVGGAIVGLSAGSAVITVTDGATGMFQQVPVTVTAFSPSPFSAHNTPGFAHNVDIDGNLAFIADGLGGLQILDVSGGAIIGKLSFGGYPVLDVRLRGKVAAVALGDGGFALVDVADATHPAVLSHTASSGTTRDLWVSGDLLYLASTDGLHVYDIANLAAPVSLGVQAFAAAATAVSADSTRGVVVVLTDAPEAVVLVAGGPLPWPSISVPLAAAINQADDVVLSGTSAYVANGTAGLVEIDVTNPVGPFVKASSAITFNALGVALRRTEQGTVVAAADNMFVNAVPLFGEHLDFTYGVDFSAFPGDVQFDANGTGIALGNGFGVVTVGDVGVQVFRTQQLTDNAGVAPTVALAQPIHGSKVAPGDLYFFSATAVDDAAVLSVEFLLDGVVVGTDDVAPFTAQAPVGAPCTTQTLEARATDYGGNVGLSLPVQVSVLCADGQACSSNSDCASGICGGGSCQPCTSGLGVHIDCASVKASCPNAASGTFTIDPDGAGPGLPFPAYCEMTLGGGGWTMVAKLTNQDAKHWIDAKSSWTDAIAYGNAADLSTGQDAKSPAWGAVTATDFLLTDNIYKASGGFIQTTSSCLGGQTMSQFFTTALASYPDFSGDTFYKQCATYNTYVPNWTTESNFYGQTPQSPSNSLNQGYLTIGYANGGDTQAVVSFYALGFIAIGPAFTGGIESEADVGLGASERDGDPFGLGDGQKQDIGGAQGCSVNDAVCQIVYPETVYMFAR